MSRAQIILLAIAAAAAAGALLLWQLESLQTVRPVETVAIEQVLVAAQDLGYGMRIVDASTRWLDWPIGSGPPGAITKSLAPDARAEIDAAYVRHPVMRGELIRRDNLIKGISPGVMPSIVAQGRRAVGIEASLSRSAGGFVLPGDHVDVYGFFKPGENGASSRSRDLASDLVVANVRVLAVASSAEEKGEIPRCPPGVGGQTDRCPGTLTLELTPEQTRCVLDAQKNGPLSLVVRAFSDAFSAAPATDDGKAFARECESTTNSGIIIVRRGDATTLRAR
jgi:pilus assembly protein CpaB